MRLRELAARLGCALRGDGEREIRGVAGLDEAGPDELSFLANPRYAEKLKATRAGAVVVGPAHETKLPSLVSDNPYLTFARAVALLRPEERPAAGVHASAQVDPSARLGDGVHVGPLAVVGAGVRVGARSVIHARVVLYPGVEIGDDCVLHAGVSVREGCRIGHRVLVQNGAVIGSDGFGFATEKGVHHKIPQVGIVVIEDDVELGANVTVDRARFGRTVIGKGTKIDNLVQIGHNVVLGQGCLLVSQSGIAGSTRVGNYVMMAGQAGVVGHLEIGDQAIITAQTGVTKDVPAKGVVSGSPALNRRTHLKELAALSKLPEALQEIRKLRREIEELRKKS